MSKIRMPSKAMSIEYAELNLYWTKQARKKYNAGIKAGKSPKPDEIKRINRDIRYYTNKIKDLEGK